jgi:hypothetical protein
MSAAGAQIRANPHANKTARQVFERPALDMRLSGFRHDQLAVTGRE